MHTDLKSSRDRFVAFAFTAADLLLELDEEGAIRFAAGAAKALLGHECEDLRGRRLDEFLVPADQALLRMVCERARQGHRLGPFSAELTAGRSVRFHALGFSPGEPLYLSLLRADEQISWEERDPVTGLVRERRFLRHVREKLHRRRADEPPLALTMVLLKGLPGSCSVPGAEATSALLASIGALLRAWSGCDEAATSLGEGRFVVLHELPDAAPTFLSEIEQLVEGGDFRDLIRLSHRNMQLDEVMLSEEETRRALSYTLAAFAASDTPPGFENLSEALNRNLAVTAQRIAEIRTSLRSSGFHLAYQPIVRLDDGSLHHCEALLRLVDGQSPQEVIRFAEEVGIVAEIDLAVVGKALRQLKEHRAAETGLRVAVNLSARSLESDRFVDTLVERCRAAGTLGGCLWFEITETFEIRDLERADRILEELRAMKHRIWLDDFGAGAAAFHYLRSLSVDGVKLDGSYALDAASDPRRVSVLRAILGLCRELGVGSTMEHIERPEQAEFARSLGAEFGQGYLFGKPEPELPAPGGVRGPVDGKILTRTRQRVGESWR